MHDAWRQPQTATRGIVCELIVTQVPGGEVTNARVGNCNGDPLVRQSIVDAAYRASPLPPPPDPSLFERSLIITFRPD
jgi:colicin import membrane protein